MQLAGQSAGAAELPPTPKPATPPQYVMLAFDGGWDSGFWKESRDFAASNNVHFTYFISCVYYVAEADKKLYIEPFNGPGKSTIGWGGKPEEIAERLKQTAAAKAEGNEIASHGCGHYDGGSYTAAMWTDEFTQFNSIMANAWKRYGMGDEPAGWSDYFRNQRYSGFRAPFLSFNKDALWTALSNLKFVYDTSEPKRAGDWPIKDNGLWEFPLAVLRIAGTNATTLSMDYNFYYAQSGAHEAKLSNHQRYEDQTFETYMAYFKASYYGNRAPINIGHHFSQWNGGAYWKAMKRFASAVCNSKDYPDVKCATYSDLVDFLNAHQAELNDYQKANFEKAGAGTPVADKPAPARITTSELHLARPVDPVKSHIN